MIVNLAFELFQMPESANFRQLLPGVKHMGEMRF
jgi:hypothetical protein